MTDATVPLAPFLGRRGALLGLAGLCAAAGPVPFPSTATLLVSGPPGGSLDRWADLVAPTLLRALPGSARLARRTLGGVDGVTGANNFEALVPPDGATALLVPGAAPLVWLAGDLRAQFDPSRWVLAWAALGPAVLLSRAPLAPGQPLRVPALGAAGPALPMLLALDLMGVPVRLLPPAEARSPEVDAVFLCGPGTPAAVEALRPAGLHPVLALGTPDAAGVWGRDPAFPDLPTAVHQASAHAAPAALLTALRATAAAVQMDAALVLPELCPASLVAAWRQASTAVTTDPDTLTAAAAQGVRSGSAATASAVLDAIVEGGPAIPALREWIAARYA